MISILTKKIRKVQGDHHFMNVDVNDSHMERNIWVSWFSTLSFQQNIHLNTLSYVIYCQNDRKKMCNQVSIHLCGLLLFLTFSLGLVMCLIPPIDIGNEEMVVVKSIPDSQGNFWNSDIWPIHWFIWMLYLKIFISRLILELKLWSYCLNNVKNKKNKSSFDLILKYELISNLNMGLVH